MASTIFRVRFIKMNQFRHWAVVAILYAISIFHTLGQEPDSLVYQALDEIVVSDSRFNLKRENSGKTVITINSTELRNNLGRSVTEIINDKSGIEISGSRGHSGAIPGVFVRGGRGRQVLVLMDGVRVNDPSSFSQEYDLRLLAPSRIESIEIIKGAASTLYGTNAATAVINITTKDSSHKNFSADFQSAIGTDQTTGDKNYNISEFSHSASVHGTLNRFSYALGFSNRYSDGLSAISTDTNEIDIFSKINTDVKIGYRFTDHFKIRFFGNQTKLKNDYDESFGLEDAPYRFISEQERFGIASDVVYKNGSLNLNTAYSTYDSENISAFPSTFKGSNYVADLYNKYTIHNNIYTVMGLQYIRDQVAGAEDVNFTIIDPYANMVLVTPFGLNFNIGGRLNNHSEYGTHFVYNINPSYAFLNQHGYVKLLGSYATSYITPSLPQLFGEFGANPDLEPETDRTIEAGLEYSVTNKVRVNGLYFNRKEKDFVFFDNDEFQFLNAENTIVARGVEVELHWNVTKDFTLNSNYTFTERTGDNAIRIPKHKANTVVSYNVSGATYMSMSYAYTGTRSDTDFDTGNDIDLAPFSLVNLFFSQDILPKRLRMSLGVTNILNKNYTEVLGFTTRGRNVRVGMDFSF